MSFLRHEETGYEQAPYEPISKKKYEQIASNIKPIERFDDEEGGTGSKFCTNDTCTI